jgi:hypothetical protein
MRIPYPFITSEYKDDQEAEDEWKPLVEKPLPRQRQGFY